MATRQAERKRKSDEWIAELTVDDLRGVTGLLATFLAAPPEFVPLADVARRILRQAIADGLVRSGA